MLNQLLKGEAGFYSLSQQSLIIAIYESIATTINMLHISCILDVEIKQSSKRFSNVSSSI